MAGVNLADIADLMGHKDLATTQIYARVQQEHLRSVIGKLTPLVPAENDVSRNRVTHSPTKDIAGQKILSAKDLDDPRDKVAGHSGRVSELGYDRCVIAEGTSAGGDSGYSAVLLAPLSDIDGPAAKSAWTGVADEVRATRRTPQDVPHMSFTPKLALPSEWTPHWYRQQIDT